MPDSPKTETFSMALIPPPWNTAEQPSVGLGAVAKRHQKT